jgi:hypothetical protein
LLHRLLWRLSSRSAEPLPCACVRETEGNIAYTIEGPSISRFLCLHTSRTTETKKRCCCSGCFEDCLAEPLPCACARNLRQLRVYNRWTANRGISGFLCLHASRTTETKQNFEGMMEQVRSRQKLRKSCGATRHHSTSTGKTYVPI